MISTSLSPTTQAIIHQELMPNLSKITKIPKDIIKKIIPSKLQENFPEITTKLIEDITKTSLVKDPKDKSDKLERDYKIEKINELFQKLEIAMGILNNIKKYKVPEDSKYIHFSPIASLINKSTVLAGAMKDWSPLRLLSSKHASLEQIGSQHVILNNRLGDDIDAVYIDVKKFSEALNKFGGEKSLFKPKIASSLYPFKGQHIKLLLPEDREINALKIKFNLKTLDKDNEITQFYESLGYHVHVHMGSEEEEGGFYVFTSKDMDARKDSPLKAEEPKPKEQRIQAGEENIFSHIADPFRGYYFEKYSQELADVLANLGISETPWTYANIGGHGYLVRTDDVAKIKLTEEKHSKIDHYPISPFESNETGTVLMAMNQIEVYEQYCHEMLTFLLEDANVMSYNNAGKGLSLGKTDIANVQEAAEICYQFLHQVKKIPDDKILAKGQCFGGAPTAWLGSQHTNINLMIDQAPANFRDIGKKKIVQTMNRKKQMIKDHESLKYKFLDRLSKSHVIDDVAKAVMIGFDVAEDIKKNQGHNLIHINLPTLKGVGGDKLVPEHHPELMIDSFAMKPNKVYKLSVFEGGTHVIDWFDDRESYQTILQFLNKTNLAPNVSYDSDSINAILEKRKKIENNIDRQIKKMDQEIKNLNELRLQDAEIKREHIDLLITDCLNYKAKMLTALANVQNVLHKESHKVSQRDEEFTQMTFNSVLIKPLKNRLNSIDATIQSLEQFLLSP